MNQFEHNLENECTLKAVRSGGKGGQHVNKVSTKIELSFDIAASQVLTEDQKAIILQKLASRITDEGLLKLTEESDRSQHVNREKVFIKLYALLENALKPVKKRKKTKIPKAVKEKRLKSKKLKSETKKLRKVKFD